MKRTELIAVVALCLGLTAPATAAWPTSAVNGAQWKRTVASGSSPLVLKTQVLLDRSFISPGAIDAAYGSNVRKALVMYQNVHKLPRTGKIDRATWKSLTGGADQPILTAYTITKDDVNGPFVRKIPAQIRQQAKLKRMAYTSPAELLAERFHMSGGLLKKLNPGVNFKQAGAKIRVPNVLGRKPKGDIKTIVIDKKAQTVKAYGKNGRVIAFYPATVGSASFPSPKGRVKVRTVAERPTYTYSRKLAYAKLKKGEKAIVLPPGPNNPVGIVWIDLNREGYGIHGTPEPMRISKAESHGCVRLTNWDAQELAGMVEPGTPVIFG